MSDTVLFIDAMSLFVRHYVRNPAMTTHGQQAGGIVGFLNALRQLIEEIRPRQTYVIWEGGGSSRRRAIFPEYKSNRRPPKLNRYYEDDIPDSNENRIYQIKTLINVLKSTPICQLFIEDCEADDVIGFLVRNRFKNDKKIIASSDRDFYQLIDENTMIYSWASKKFLGTAEVLKQFNILPENFVLAKAICGDNSDAIPGVSGIGFKTLAKRFDLFSKQVTLNDILIECETKQRESKVKVFSQISKEVELIKRNWRLMYLDTSNLAAAQVRKIDAVVESFKPSRNKMQMMRTLLDEGLGAFDSHEFFSVFTIV